jgi:hypothetical protein
MGVDWFLGHGWGGGWLRGKMAPAKPYFTDPTPTPPHKGEGAQASCPVNH